MSSERSTRAAAEVNRINLFYPLMPSMGTRWAKMRPWEGKCIAVNAHLTTLTAALLRELSLGGGKWVVSAADEATTDHAVVELLRELGIEVHTGGDVKDQHLAVLDHEPNLIADVGFDLVATLLDRAPEKIEHIEAAVEITRSGITDLRKRTNLPFGVVNINDGQLKPHVENRHGVGEALWGAVRQITGLHLAGRRVLVVGYGAVGQGLAAYARAAGSVVEVVDITAIRRLTAHYDGFPTPDLEDALSRVEIAVTATGEPNAIPISALEKVGRELVLVNAGHGGDEIDVAGLRAKASEGVEVGSNCTRYRLGDSPWLSLLGNGHPLNIVTNSGSPEPVLLHFALLGLTLEWLAQHPVPTGECEVPGEIEELAASLALTALQGK
ncbi:MAG: NAD(P)-dependent oxidoreductase [Myxococcota bacterium]|nr:NAD(P)-dependent oxidoreductase [Myxococcota bacterium]